MRVLERVFENQLWDELVCDRCEISTTRRLILRDIYIGGGDYIAKGAIVLTGKFEIYHKEENGQRQW